MLLCDDKNAYIKGQLILGLMNHISKTFVGVAIIALALGTRQEILCILL